MLLVLLEGRFICIIEIKGCTCRKKFYVVRIVLLLLTASNGLSNFIAFALHRIPFQTTGSHHVELLIGTFHCGVIIAT